MQRFQNFFREAESINKNQMTILELKNIMTMNWKFELNILFIIKEHEILRNRLNNIYASPVCWKLSRETDQNKWRNGDMP